MATARIVSLETFAVDYPVVGDFRYLPGGQQSTPRRRTVVVRVRDEDGNFGWGQCVPSPTWSYETIETVRSTLEVYLAPTLLGVDAFDSVAVQQRMDRAIAPSFSTGQPLCKAGIDLALFDLTGRILQQDLATRWGRTGRATVTLSWTIDAPGPESVPLLFEQARQRGFRHFNVKVGRDPRHDVAVCQLLRELAPEAFIWVDANGGYDLETALHVAPQFAELGVAAFEQPVAANRLSWFRALRRQGALPVLMDEPIVSAVELAEFHELGLLDGVAMKVARCGGLSEARRIMEYVEQRGLLFFASGLTDPDIAFAASLLLLAAFDLQRPAALNAPQFLTGTILHRPIAVAGDQAEVPAGAGLGVEVDERALAAPGSLGP